ncbi:MAG: hypothetical protein POELPBGB_02412 [Bacteroidia bacterium]|nr:hypothetical protein [Bacteroidia bacterium]
MKTISTILLFTVCILHQPAAQNWINPQPSGQGLEGIVSPTIQEFEQFGSDVSISGDYAAVSAYGHDLDEQGLNPISGSGAVYIYKKAGGVWSMYQKIVAADRSQNLVFGMSVSINGDYVVIGAPQSTLDENGNNFLESSGAVYIFKLNNGVWEQQQKIVPIDRMEYDRFGEDCDIDGDYVVVRSNNVYDENGDNPMYQAGAAYVFKQTNGVWAQQQKIVPDDRAVEDGFAVSVAISGDRIICGAPNHELDASGNNSISDAGAAYIFKLNGTNWEQEQKLVNSDRHYTGWFGSSVDMEANYAVISATGNVTDANNQNPIEHVGAAYVFIHDQTGWIQQTKLVPDDRVPDNNFFGNDVAISGNYILIGMAQDDGDMNDFNRAGSAYLFMLNNGRWNQYEKLHSWFPFTDYFFGNAVAIDGLNIIIGEGGYSDFDLYNYIGAVYFFNPAPLALDVNSNAASCQNAADGSADVTVIGGYYPINVTVGSNTLTGSGTVYGLSAGNYSVTAVDFTGSTAGENISVGQGSGVCAGSIVLQSDESADYFDTITVSVSIADAANLFSVYGKLYFDSTLMYMLDYSEEGFFGTTNIITTPPVVLNGVIDFGVTKTVGQPGVNGSGAFFTFRFVLHDLPVNVPFNSLNPDSIATLFTLDNLTIYDAVGSLREVETPAPALTFLRYYIPVWPGDLNNDYQVNVADILPIGYFYNNEGPVRPNASLQWVAQPAQLWGFDRSFRNRSAYKTFADGNGNGLIDLADQSAIGFNLSRVHNFQLPVSIYREKGNSLPPLMAELTPEQLDSTQLPATLSIPVKIGSNSNPVNNLYGVAFDLLYEAAYVDTTTIQLDFSNSVFGTQNVDYIRIEDLHPGQGRLSIGLTRYNSTELFCAGDEVVTVTLTIKENVPTGWFKFITVPLDASNLTGDDIELGGWRDSVYIITPIPNAVAPVEKPAGFSVYPNPANESIVVNVQSLVNSTGILAIYSATGQLVHSENLFNNRQQVNVSGLSNGVYCAELKTEHWTASQKLIIQKSSGQ